MLPSLLGHRARPPPPRAMEPCRPPGYFKVNPIPYSIIALIFPRRVPARRIWLGLKFRATQKWVFRPEIAPGQPGKITQNLGDLSSGEVQSQFSAQKALGLLWDQEKCKNIRVRAPLEIIKATPFVLQKRKQRHREGKG